MNFKQEFMLNKNIGTFVSGQKITGIKILTLNGDVKVDLDASPDWFTPLRESWVPAANETYFYIDENFQVQQKTWPADVENVQPNSPEGMKLMAGNVFKTKLKAQNVANRISEDLQKHNRDLGEKEQVERRNAPKDNKSQNQGGGLA